jgi:hypothetical protein
VSDTPDSVGQVTEIPAGVDPIAALEAMESAPPDSQDPTPPVAQPAAETTPEAQPPEAEWFMPGTFRTAEDMRENYQQLASERGRLAQEVGDLRRQVQAPQQPQVQQPQGPQVPSFNHPAQGYTQEQLEQLAYDNPLQAADYMAMLRTGDAIGQLIPAIAPLMESVNQQEARSAVDSLRREFGDEVVQRHSEALAAVIQQDEGYFIDEATRRQRLSMAVQSLEYQRINQQAQAQPRDQNGQFAAKPEPVHVEPGSSGAQAPAADPQVDPVVAEMRGVKSTQDRFGIVPSGLARSQAATRA